MCNFKIAFIARECEEEVQSKTVRTILSFTSFLKQASDQDKKTNGWIKAISIITECLLSLATFLSGDHKLDLFEENLELAKMGTTSTASKSNAIDRAKILRA